MTLEELAQEAVDFSSKQLYALFGDDVETGQAERKEGDPKDGNKETSSETGTGS